MTEFEQFLKESEGGAETGNIVVFMDVLTLRIQDTLA